MTPDQITEARALVERLLWLESQYRSAGRFLADDFSEAAAALTAALDQIEALEAQQENAVQAMAETHNSWEARCYAIMAMLEQDFGGFSTDAPDVGSWYEANSRRLQKRIEELEAKNKRLREALLDATAHFAGASSAYKTFAARHPKWGTPTPDALFGTRFKDFDAAVERARAALKGDDQ